MYCILQKMKKKIQNQNFVLFFTNDVIPGKVGILCFQKISPEPFKALT